MGGGSHREGEYFGQFWGSGVPRFGGGVRQDLQPVGSSRNEEPKPGEWCATWAWTKQPAGNKKLRPAPRASAPLLHIDEAIRRLKAKPSYDAGSVKVKALSARRKVLSMKPFKPEHGPRGFGSSIKTDRGVDPRSRAKVGGTRAGKRKPLRSGSKSIQRPEFSAPHSYRRRDVQHIAAIQKKLGKVQALKEKVAQGERLTLHEQQQVKPVRPDMLKMWQDPTLRSDHKALITNRIDELEGELAALQSRKSGFGTSQQTYRGTQSPLCPWSSVDPGTLNIRADAHKIRAPKTMCPPTCANVPIGAKTALVFDKEGHLVSSLADQAEDMGQDMMTTKPFYQFAQGLSEEERAAAAQETIRRRALNNLTVLKRKLRAASYTIDGNDWNQLFKQSDSDGNGTLDSDEFRAMVRRCGITHITDVELDVLYNAIDVDGSGDIEVEEFISFLTDKTVHTKLDISAGVATSDPAVVQNAAGTGRSASLVTVPVQTAVHQRELPAMPRELHSVMEQLQAAIRADRTLYGQAVSDARSLFAAIDTNADGKISVSEFGEALERLDIAKLLQPHEMERLFSVMDRSADGMIDWEDFLLFSGLEDEGHSAAERAVRKAQRRLKMQQEMVGGARVPLKRLDKASQHAIFDRMDANGNGILSLAELDKAIIELYPEFNHKPALMRAYKAADVDHDGWIERREFGNFLHYLVYFNNLWHLFEAIDADGDRRIDFSEFVAGCRHVGFDIATAEARSEFAAMAGVNGHILFIDFCRWCARRHIADDQAEKENEHARGGYVQFDESVDTRTISPTGESQEYALESSENASASAAVGVVTPGQQELLDYVEDLYEMAALGLITGEELEERKNAVIDELEASVLAGESRQHADGEMSSAAAAADEQQQKQGDDARSGFRNTEVRAPGPSHTNLRTQRIAARLSLPDQQTCDRLFNRFDHHRVETLPLPALQSLVADLWQTDEQPPPVPSVIERAFRGAELDEARRLHRRDCRDVLKCIIYLDTMSDVLADISVIDKLTREDFVNACAAINEPITARDAQAEFRQLRDEDNVVSFDKFCMWLARRNVLDATATPTLAGPVVVPYGSDIDTENAGSTAKALVAAHEMAETLAQTALQSRAMVAKGQRASQPADAEKEGSVEFMAPAEVQTDIPELVLGGESCPKVPIRSLTTSKPTGTGFDLRNEHHAVSWRTNREIEREVAHRQGMERLTQVSNGSTPRGHQSGVPRSASGSMQQIAATSSRSGQGIGPSEEAVAPTQPVVVDVEPVVLGTTTYLVDKANAVVYSNVVEPGQEPVVVGRWNAKMPAATPEVEDGPDGTDAKNGSSAAQRWTNSGAIGSSTSTGQTQCLVDDTAELRDNSSKVRFSSHAHIDVGAVPTVQAESGSTHEVPLWSAKPSDDVGTPATAARPARQKNSKTTDKLQFLASHGLDDWPNPNDDKLSGAPRPVQMGRYHQKNTRMKAPADAQAPSPRSPRWDLPTDKKEVGRDLAPSSPRGVRRPIEDGIRVLRTVNGTKHTGNSHTPGVTQSRTLPPRERNWAGLTDDPLIRSQRDSTNEQVLKEHPPKKLDPAEEAAFNASLAMERRVLASDDQSWAYLSLQRMAEERDLVATNPEHFIDKARQQHSSAEPRASMANYRLGQRRAQREKAGSGRQQRVSISEENNRYSDSGVEPLAGS